MTLRHSPAPEAQTSMRKSMAFWIVPWESFQIDSDPNRDSPARMATWLVRSLANPEWHGIEADAPTGQDPLTNVMRTCRRLLGVTPKYWDRIGALQPGDAPEIRHTTYIQTALSPTPLLPRPLPGVELGVFPLDDLPTEDLRPSLRPWLAHELQIVTKGEMSPYHATYYEDERERY